MLSEQNVVTTEQKEKSSHFQICNLYFRLKNFKVLLKI